METLVLVSSMNVHDWNHIPDEMFGMWDDNGGDPDGNAWLPVMPIPADEVGEVIRLGLGVMTEASYLDDDEMAAYIKDPAVLALAREAEDWDAMKNAVAEWCAERGRVWAHYGSYGASDSQWVVARQPAEYLEITQAAIDEAHGDWVWVVSEAGFDLPAHDELRWDQDNIEAVRGRQVVAVVRVR